MDILELLRAKDGFTATESKIADYVLRHLRQVSGMSAHALAKETFSSNASVIRMCRKMGFSGYREFQLALAVRLSRAPGTDTAARGGVMERLAQAVADAAGDCLRHVPRESLARAAEWLSGANRLYVYGAGWFDALAFSQALSGLGIAAVPELWDENPDTGPGDAALFVGRGAFGRRMAYLRERGCRVIAVSTESACPEADIHIRVPRGAAGCPCAEAAYAQAALLYVASCLRCMTGAARGRTS